MIANNPKAKEIVNEIIATVMANLSANMENMKFMKDIIEIISNVNAITPKITL